MNVIAGEAAEGDDHAIFRVHKVHIAKKASEDCRSNYSSPLTNSALPHTSTDCKLRKVLIRTNSNTNKHDRGFTQPGAQSSSVTKLWLTRHEHPDIG